MPVIKSAIKKLRKDIKRTAANNTFRRELDMAIRAAKKTPTAKSVSKAASFVDRAVKNNLMHKNRAAHIKSSLSKLAKPTAKTAKAVVKQVAKPAEKTVKKASPKESTAKK